MLNPLKRILVANTTSNAAVRKAHLSNWRTRKSTSSTSSAPSPYSHLLFFLPSFWFNPQVAMVLEGYNIYPQHNGWLSYAGHSHWQNIKHKKERSDIKKQMVYTKISNGISTAVRLGGANPKENNKLQEFIDKAKLAGMTKEKINNAIQAGLGSAASGEKIMYEGKGPGNTSIIVMCLSENRNRSTQKVKHAFTKYGGSMGAPNSVQFLFKQEGFLELKTNTLSEEQVMDACLESNVENFEFTDNKKSKIKLSTTPDTLNTVKTALEKFGLLASTAELRHFPMSRVPLEDDEMENFEKMLEAFNNIDDVVEVIHNVEIEDEEETA